MDVTRKLRVGYLRESQARGDDESAITRHRAECVEKANEIGWYIDKWYVDNDVSAYKKNRVRRDYDQLLVDIAAGEVAGIITWDPDRMHRDTGEGVVFIDLMERHRVELVTVLSGHFDLATAAGRKRLRDAHSDAQFESERKSERVRSGARWRAREGGKRDGASPGARHNGGLRQFGYVDAARSALDEDEAGVTRGATDLLLRGGSQGEVVRLMNDAPSRTPVRPGRRMPRPDDDDKRPVYGPPPPFGGRPWTVVKMQRLLTSASVAGAREHLGEIVAHDAWPAIITWDEHERVVAIITGSKGRGRGRGPRTRSYLMSDLAVCGRPVPTDGDLGKICGTPLIAQPYRGRRAYRCPQPSRTVNGAKGCGGSRIYADVLDEYVVNLAMAFAVDPDRIDYDRRTAEQRSAEEARVRAELERLRVKEANLADAVVDGMPREQYKRKQAELVEERSHLEHRLAELTSALEPALVQGSTATDARRRFDALELGQQRAVLRSLLHHERPIVVRSVTDARRLGKPRIEVRPDWAPALAKANEADEDVDFIDAVPVEERLLEPAD